MNDYEDVAIFWDYENCTPHSSVAGYDIVTGIRQIAHRYGSVKLFKAYVESSESSSPKLHSLRSELQLSGVTLTDCPHNGKKEVADKMILVDMLTYAIDTPAPATIVLISGDRDFTYAVSILRLRRYPVVLITPAAVHTSLKRHASAILEWNQDVLQKTARDAGVFSDVHADMHSAPSLVPALPTVPQTKRRASFMDNTSGLTASVVPANGHRPKDSTPQSASHTAAQIPEIPELRSPIVGRVDVGRNGGTISGLNVNLKNINNIGGAAWAISDSLNIEVSRISPSDVVENELCLQLDLPTPLPMHKKSAETPCESEQRSSGMSDITVETDDSAFSPLPSDLCTPTPERALSPSTAGFHLSQNMPSASRDDPANDISDNSKATADYEHTEFLSKLPRIPGSLPTGLATLQFPYPPSQIPVNPRQHLSQPPPSIPEQYKLLVQTLDRYRLSGILRPLRSIVALTITTKDPFVYKSAGVKTFAKYVADAQRVGLVQVGGIQGTAWITLVPALYGTVIPNAKAE